MTEPSASSTNGLLRPPVLNNTNTRNSVTTIDLTELTEQISQIVKHVLTRDGPTIISRILNPNSDSNDDEDQTINTTDDRNLSELDKIPDIIKSLREFSGQPSEFSSWKKSVDRILKLYEHLKGTSKYYGILSVVRNKIVGHADIALESYNTPLNWVKISRCLTLHYADKRDLGTLEYQMTTLVQGNHSVQEFYQIVYQHLSLILSKLGCMDMGNESLGNMTRSYREKALDTFVRGLKGDLPRLLSIREPVDLPQALHLCLKLQNIDYRTQYANNSQYNMQRKQHLPPPLPPRRKDSHHYNLQRPFYPELLHNPQKPLPPHFAQRHPQAFNKQPFQPFQKPQPQFSFRPNMGYQNRPFQRPEPMEVDPSTQSKRMNYMNRPRLSQFPQKRPMNNQSQQAHNPNKIQRIFHTEPYEDEIESPEDYEQEADTKDNDENTYERNDHTFPDYTESVANPHFEEPEELEDIYFLDSPGPHSHITN